MPVRELPESCSVSRAVAGGVRRPYTRCMDSEKRLTLSNGRVLVAAFLTLMGVLFTLTALIFDSSPEQWTILAVAAFMYIGGITGFVLAIRHRN